MSSSTRSPNVWHAQLSGLILFFTWGYSFWPAIKAIFTIYSQSSYDHYGFVSFIIVLWLFWVHRNKVAHFDPSPNIYGLIAIIIISIAWLLAFWGNWLFLQNVLLVSLLPLIVLATAGIRITTALVFPISCMILLIPVGYLIVPHVLNVVFKILNIYLKLINFGWYLQDPDELHKVKKLFFEVDYLVANFIFVISFSYFKLENILNRILFILSGMILPIVLNLVVASLILSIQFLGLVLPSVLYSSVSVIVYCCAIFVCILIFKKSIIKVRIDLLNVVENIRPGVVFWDPYAKWFKLTMVASFALIIPSYVANNISNNPWIEDYKLKFFLEAPSISEWIGPDNVLASKWQPKFFGSTAQILASYSAKQKEVLLYSAYYYKILQTGGLIDSNNKLYDDGYWTTTQVAGRTVPLFKSKLVLLINEVILIKDARKQLIWYWYYVGDMVSNDRDFMYMLNGVKTVANMRDDAGIIAIATEFEPNTNIEEVRARLIYFINSIEPKLKNIMHPEKHS